MADNFQFNLEAKRNRFSDDELLTSLQKATITFGEVYFPSTKYDALPEKQPHSSTIIDRFGSWKKALALIGIIGGREREYSPEQLIDNLEKVWKELGFPPGKRQISKLGEKISEQPYNRIWGSVRAACEALAAHHAGNFSRERLLAGIVQENIRVNIPLKDRWVVLKRDGYRCVRCGASPSKDIAIELEVDHVFPVAKGGKNTIDNLQTLCRMCNQGKKDRI